MWCDVPGKHFYKLCGAFPIVEEEDGHYHPLLCSTFVVDVTKCCEPPWCSVQDTCLSVWDWYFKSKVTTGKMPCDPLERSVKYPSPK